MNIQIIIFFAYTLIPFYILSQNQFISSNIFQTDYFIENKGQFDFENKSDIKTLYASEISCGNLHFHKNGFIIIQKKLKSRKHNRKKESDRESANQEFLEKHIRLEWIGANSNCEIFKENKSNHYFSYGAEEYKSFGYKKLTYKNIYPNIDIVYTIEDNNRFHYSVILHPGAKPSDIKFKYTGCKTNLDSISKSLKLDNILVPIYEYGLHAKKRSDSLDSIICNYKIDKNIISFHLDIESIEEDIEIDPWVGNTDSLSGDPNREKKGFDVDFDNVGNLYVFGGGTYFYTKISKYTLNGILLWTFNCSIPSLNWPRRIGFITNFIVDKTNSKVYTGEVNTISGSRVIRLNSNGIYDNFISIANPNFFECWEFQFNCNTNDIVVMGGTTTTNLNMGIINKVNGTMSIANITGLSYPYAQDAASSCIDNNSDMYVIFASDNPRPFKDSIDNVIYKVNSTFNGYIWRKPSSYSTLSELYNKPHAQADGNSCNVLSSNSKYLFYYDGKYLKAFNKFNGSSIGNPDTLNLGFALYQGGIESDECNNIYIGSNNGSILIYHFDNINFTLKDSIVFSNQANKHIYDIKASRKNNMLYVSGEGFVALANFNYCDSSRIRTTYSTNCIDSIRIAIENPTPSGIYSFEWKDLSTNNIVKSKLNTTETKDTFLGVVNKSYEISISKNSICNPAVVTKTFTISNKDSIVIRNIKICTGTSYSIGNHKYNISGVYLDTILENGCRAIIKTNLSIINNFIDTVRILICNGDSINIKGKFIKLAGIYRDTFPTLKGCDSILIYLITNSTASSSKIHLFDTICANQSKFFNNQSLTSTGIYTQILKNIYGCDSTIILNLFVRTMISSIINVSICENKSYQFKNRNLTVAGTYYDTIIRSSGCDSFVVLELKVDTISKVTINKTICKGQSYIVGNNNYSIAGTHIVTLQNNKNCDSIITLNLTVLDTTLILLSRSICNGQSVRVGNNIYTFTGKYTIPLKNIYNCDSTILLDLKVNSNYYIPVNGKTCFGVPYDFQGQRYNVGGVYQKKYQSIYGCDSIYELRLSISEISGGSNYELCVGDSLKINYRFIKQAGEYYDTLKLKSGCDSIHISTVKIIPWSAKRLDTLLCLDDSFVYKGKAYRGPTTIEDTIFSKYKYECYQNYFIHLDFITCDTVNECQRILIPTGFSPNNDGINDKLIPIVKSDKISILDFTVVNRWGERVYNYFDDKNGWNGVYNNEESSTGVYSYQLKYKCKGKQYIQSGNTTLIR